VAKATSPRRKRRQKDQQSADPVAREVNDILQKYLTRGVSGSFLQAFGLDFAPIVEVLPSELPVLEVRLEHPDRFFRLADGVVLDTEFQMTREEGDLERFYDYQIAGRKTYQARVYTLVFYGPGIVSAPAVLDCGSAIFTVQQVFIGQWDGEAVVQTLRDGIASGAEIDEVVLTRLKLLPLMKHQRPLEEVVREVAELTRVLPPAVREETIGTMLGLGYNYLEPSVIEQLLKEPTVANALEQLVRDSLTRGKTEGVAEGRVEGIAEGRVEGIAEGRMEGRTEGRREGLVEGQRAALTKVLVSRFGPLPAVLETQLAAITDPTALATLIDTALAVPTLEGFRQAVATLHEQ